MNPYVYTEPFEDEDLEARAWAHFEQAREQGSLLPEAQLIEECRKIAHDDVIRLIAAGDDPVPISDDDDPSSRFDS